jgi:hypothetical protein
LIIKYVLNKELYTFAFMKKLILSALSLFICPYFAFAQTDSAYVTVNMSSENGFLVRNLNYS